mgnify:CR=1 FL=1
MEKRLKAYVAEGNGKEFIGEFTLELLDDRPRMEGQDGVAEKGYDKVRKLVTDKDRLYIYTGSMTAVIVPLHAFGSGEAYRKFRQLLEEKTRAAGGMSEQR